MSISKHSSLLLIFVFLLFSCESAEQGTDFLDWKIPQNESERNIIGTLALADSLLLAEVYGMAFATGIKQDNDYLYIVDSPRHDVFVIDKMTFEHRYTVSPEEGRGPGELVGIGSIDVHSPYVVIPSENLLKVQLWEREGEFVREYILDQIKPHRAGIYEDGYITVLSPMSANPNHVFHTLDGEGDPEISFGEISPENYNPIKYSGVISTEDEYFYYAGFSEHLLQKWNRNGSLYFSRSTIEDVPGDINYLSFESGEHRSHRYSEHGVFSAIGLDLLQDYVLIMHGGNRNEDPYHQFLDIYDKHEGEYVASVILPYIASSGSFVVDMDYLYVMHRIDDEIYLGIYESDFLVNPDIND